MARPAPASAQRVFCDILEDHAERPAPAAPAAPAAGPVAQDRADALAELRRDTIGRLSPFKTPYGEKRMIYADWTATGRALGSIERYIEGTVLPLYGNTHTTTSITGKQSTAFRHEARQIVAEACNARISGRAASDVVLFTGSGTTGALVKLVAILGLHRSVVGERPVVFVGPYEHHSNMLPWRESEADVVNVPEHADGGPDLRVLEELLAAHASRRLKIGAFAAASNVTGMLTDVYRVQSLLRRHGAFGVFDYATAAPHALPNMNPPPRDGAPDCPLDCIVFSGHKFLGGCGTPGVLACKKAMLVNDVPSAPGGGTVFYVTDGHQRYLSNREEREEGGTPDIVGTLRLALSMKANDAAAPASRRAAEDVHTAAMLLALATHPNIVLLGAGDGEARRAKAWLQSGAAGELGSVAGLRGRLPIASFLIRCGERFLHFNFVCALLNDLFGIQARGGCVCSGPYGQRLLGIHGEEANAAVEAALLAKQELLRPGWSRLSLPAHASADEVAYILGAVRFVASFGAAFLGDYAFDHRSGEWRHRSQLRSFKERRWLSDFALGPPARATRQAAPEPAGEAEILRRMFAAAVRAARERVGEAPRSAPRSAQASEEGVVDEALRWFVWPSEAPAGAAPSDLDEGAAWTGLEDFFGGAGAAPDGRGSNDAMAAAIRRAIAAAARAAPGTAVATATAAAAAAAAAPPAAAEARSPGAIRGIVQPPNAASRGDGGGASAAGEDAGGVKDTADVAKAKKKYVKRVSGARTEHKVPKVSAAAAGAAAGRAVRAPKRLMRAAGQAIKEWNMIEDGDRLLLGISGGKDSLSLLHMLLDLQRRAPVRFTLACATVDPQTPSFDPSPMIPYIKSLGVEYHYLSDAIVERARVSLQGDSLCAFCSRMKRGMLYACCERHGYNKLVLAQHLDDFAESFVMSALHNGQLRTMKANYAVPNKPVRVIRPLAYAREVWLRDFAREAGLPIINENCPACFEEPKERERVKKLLKKEETLFPEVFGNIRRAIMPIMDEGIYAHLRQVAKDAKGRNAAHHYRRTKEEGGLKKEAGGRKRGRAGDAAAPAPAPKRQRDTGRAGEAGGAGGGTGKAGGASCAVM